jgi:hypothetical protein
MRTGHEHRSPAEWVTLATFDTPSEGDTLARTLKGFEIEAELLDKGRVQRFWFLSRPQPGVHVRVPEPDTGVARQLVQANPAARHVFQGAITRPAVRRGYIPQATRKIVLPTFVVHLLALTGVMPHACDCEDCQFTWIRHPVSAPACPP